MFHSIQIQRDTFQKKKKNIQQPFFTILLQNPTKERFEVIPNNRDRWFLPYFTRISSSFGVTFTSAWRTVVSGDDKQTDGQIIEIYARSRNSRFRDLHVERGEAHVKRSAYPPAYQSREGNAALVAPGHVIRVNVVILVVPESHLSLSSIVARTQITLCHADDRAGFVRHPQRYPLDARHY